MLTPNNHGDYVPYSPIKIEDTVVNFVTGAEHVGVLRSTSGNMPTILSGLASLVLLGKETAIIEQQFKKTLQNILKLPVNSPSPLVHFVAGSLPATAILHLKMLTLFGMICRLPNDPLNRHARQVLLTRSLSPKSWFVEVWKLLLQYQLPTPLMLLDHPTSKESFKKQVKAKILDYWEVKLRLEASFLPSLSFFHPQYMSLDSPHKLWTTAGAKPYEVSKAKIQLMFLGSLYRCGQLTRHWSTTNPSGLCSFPSCTQYNIVESPEHVLLCCQAYDPTRQKLLSLCQGLQNQVSLSIINNTLATYSNDIIMQLILDCSAVPEVISSAQCYGDYVYNDIFYIGRTWCYSIHRERMKRLRLWNFR